MILTKTIKVKWNGLNKKHYEEKGYTFTKINDEFQIKVEDLSHGSHVKIDIKCDCEYCESPIVNILWQGYQMCIKKHNGYYCKTCAMKLFGGEKISKTRLKNSKTFEQWCIDNNRQDILDRWDYELNNKNPNEVSYGSKNKYYFKCPRELHASELKSLNNFTRGSEGVMDCLTCKSFAQYHIDNTDKDFLEKYWDYDKNKVNPMSISYSSKTKVWIKCQEHDYHGSYDSTCNDFSNSYRCPYCSSYKIHPNDSLGQILKDNNILYLWSDKNENTPFKYSKGTHKKFWWKCHNNKHHDYLRGVNHSRFCEFNCPKCNNSKGEKRICDYLEMKNISFETTKEFNGLLGMGGRNLSYDFYLPKYNLLIEYQGEQHEKFTKGIHNTIDDFNKQLIHDDLKRNYAKNNGFTLLEIWYWDFDNVEEILKKELSIE